VIASASESFHVIMASRSLEKVKGSMSEIEASGIRGAVSSVQLDVTDENSVAEAAAYVEQEFGRLDVLVNNAAVGCMDPDIKTRFQLCMDTNVIGPAVVAEAFRPLLLKSQNPYSIFVSSGAGSLARASSSNPKTYRGIKNGEAYQVSKAALNMLAVLESTTHGSKGLKVFAMCPGFVRSNLRGPGEDAISGWGEAGPAEVSGELLLGIIEGKRDADVGGFVHKDGVYPW
jgi:NAD(P)-dependent dehydrogenase (short-subunit alcohol dehydrogenase family)